MSSFRLGEVVDESRATTRPIKLDRLGVEPSEQGRLCDDVIRALAELTRRNNRLVLKVLLDKGEDPKNRFVAWRDAMSHRASDAVFGESETDGTLTFKNPGNIQVQWGNSKLSVDAEGMPFMTLSPESLIAIDESQGIQSAAGNLARAEMKKSQTAAQKPENSGVFTADDFTDMDDAVTNPPSDLGENNGRESFI